MKMLHKIDLQDYDPSWKEFRRPSVRGIILNDAGEVAMIYSRKYKFYKFPGGGMEKGETHVDTLIREVKEETGLSVIPETIKEFGEILRMQKSSVIPETIFVQENFYYTCQVEPGVGEQHLDEAEKLADFVLKFVPAKEAIAANNAFRSSDQFRGQMVARENWILESISWV